MRALLLAAAFVMSIAGLGCSAKQQPTPQAPQSPQAPSVFVFPQTDKEAWAITYPVQSDDESFEAVYTHDILRLTLLVFRERQPLANPVGACLGLALNLVQTKYMEGVPLIELASTQPEIAAMYFQRLDEAKEVRGGAILTFRHRGQVRRVIGDWPVENDGAARQTMLELFKPYAE